MTDPIQSEKPLVERIKAIIMKPAEEWPVIDAEPATPKGLILKYAVPLAAIGPVAQFLHSVLFGYGAFGFSYRPSIGLAVGMALSSYITSLVGLVALALIADFLAPHFSGVSNRTSAFKLAVFAMIPGWLAGIFLLVPGLGWLSIVGIYGLYLFYIGVTPLMKIPADKAIGYTAAVIVAGIVAALIVSAVLRPLTALLVPAAIPTSEITEGAGTLTLPGGGKVDLDKMKAAGDQMAQAVKPGGTVAVDPARLKAMLPVALGAYRQTETESSSAGAAGVNGSSVSATYTNEGKTLELRISDMAAVGALAGMAATLNVNSEKTDAQGFTRTHTEGDSLITEKWNNQSKFGSFTKVVANRFMVSAEGDAESFDQLKAAANTVNSAALEALAR